jgi:hypothetical protein
MYENNLDENIYDGTKLFKRYLKLCENIGNYLIIYIYLIS